MSVDSDNLLRHWGEHRQQPHRGLPRWIWWATGVLAVAAVGLVISLSERSAPWRAPRGASRFV